MKIILSRKGIDGGNGGVPSPLLQNSEGNWIPLSIPIGGGNENRQYGEIKLHGHNLRKLAESLGVKDKNGNELTGSSVVHFDPDLDKHSVNRKEGWKPLFGQWRSALGHLLKNDVKAGDLFLFFGWFKKAEIVPHGYRFIQDAPDLQAFFGWLQIEDILNVNDSTNASLRKTHFDKDWAWNHPHFGDEKNRGCGSIFVAAKNFSINNRATELPGAGVFQRCTETSTLTWPRQKRSVWKMPRFFHKRNQVFLTYHKRESLWEQHGDAWRLQSALRGQEFIYDLHNEKLDAADRKAASDWTFNLIRIHI